MPLVTIKKKKIVLTTKSVGIVTTAYKTALDLSQLNLNPDGKEREAKEKLDVGDKQDIPGTWACIKRAFRYHAETHDLDEIQVTLNEMSFVLLNFLEKALTDELTKVFLYEQKLDPDTILNTQQDKWFTNNADVLKKCASNQIEHPCVLICEIIRRVTAIALSDEFMARRVLELDGDKFITILKTFIDKLFENPDDVKALFSIDSGASNKISTFATFLRFTVASEWVGSINSVILNTKEINAPKYLFEIASNALKTIRIMIRGHAAIFLSQYSAILFDIQLLKNLDQLDKDVLNISFPNMLDEAIRLSKNKIDNKSDGKNRIASRHQTRASETELISINPSSSDSSMPHTQLTALADSAIEYTAVRKLFEDVISQVDSQTNPEKSIQELDIVKKALFALLEIDEQLEFINNAVSHFSDLTTIGGWVPIMLGIIRPEILSIVIKNFMENSRQVAKKSLAVISYQQKFDTIVGVIRLPYPEWEQLSNCIRGIHMLTSSGAIEKIKSTFGKKLQQLSKVQEQLVKCRLLGATQTLIDTPRSLNASIHAQGLLTSINVFNAVTINSDIEDQRSESKDAPLQASQSPNTPPPKAGDFSHRLFPPPAPTVKAASANNQANETHSNTFMRQPLLLGGGGSVKPVKFKGQEGAASCCVIL